MKKIFYIIAIALAAVCCEKAPEFVQCCELGCEYDEVEVPSLSGTCSFNVICNSEATATISKDASWLTLVGSTSSTYVFNGDKTLTFNYAENTSDERKAVVTVSSGNRTIELTIIQNSAGGKDFYFPQRNVLVPFETGVNVAKFISSVKEDEVSYTVSYENGSGWIEEPIPGLVSGRLVFATKENTDSLRRGAIITLSAKDKAGRDITANLYVSQMVNGEPEVIPVTVDDVRNFTIDDLDGDGCIRKNYVLKARVLNDNSEGNGAANRNISIINQDRTLSGRAVYLQSLEHNGAGQYCGIQLQFTSEANNSTNRYDLLEINLKGLKFTAEGGPLEDTPYHVILSGAGVVNIISTTGGTLADLPSITRTINEITDEDLYTYVCLKNCEFPIRKGPFCPVDLRYRNIINKYPMVTRDAQGNIIYMVSNTYCEWARDGKGVPQGSGDIYGIIVHERCDNFEWDSQAARESTVLPDYITDKGYIGRYQIRPITKAEIAVSESLDDASTQLLTEYRYFNSLYPEKMILTATSKSDTLYPSYPAVLDPLTSEEVNGYLVYSNGKMATGQDWSHLGPVVNDKITDIPGSNGVYDALGNNTHWSPLSYCNTTGIIQGQNGPSWHGGIWYSGSASDPKLKNYYWEVALSTEGLSAAQAPLSLNLGVSSAYGEDNGAPRYWTVEYSTDKKTWHSVTADSYSSESWVDYTAKGNEYTYTVPDFPIVSAKKQYNLPGNKNISINFPASADIWGKGVLYIHIHPTFNLSGYSSGGVSYDEGTIVNNRRSCINYLGIRCKK